MSAPMNAPVDVLCCPLPAIDSGLLARYENLLSADERKRLTNFRSDTGAKEFMVGRALLRTALAERLRCTPQELRFDINADGKPLLAHPASRWQFNLTHSHDWLALALCENGSVGIDIEAYTRRNNLPAIAKRFFAAEENAQLARYADREWLEHFFAIWTLKEAHAKALGSGMFKTLPHWHMLVDLNAGTIAVAATDAAHAINDMASWLYRLDEHCALALIAHGDVSTPPRLFRCVPLQSLLPLPLAPRAQGFNKAGSNDH